MNKKVVVACAVIAVILIAIGLILSLAPSTHREDGEKQLVKTPANTGELPADTPIEPLALSKMEPKEDVAHIMDANDYSMAALGGGEYALPPGIEEGSDDARRRHPKGLDGVRFAIRSLAGIQSIETHAMARRLVNVLKEHKLAIAGPLDAMLQQQTIKLAPITDQQRLACGRITSGLLMLCSQGTEGPAVLTLGGLTQKLSRDLLLEIGSCCPCGPARMCAGTALLFYAFNLNTLVPLEDGCSPAQALTCVDKIISDATKNSDGKLSMDSAATILSFSLVDYWLQLKLLLMDDATIPLANREIDLLVEKLNAAKRAKQPAGSEEIMLNAYRGIESKLRKSVSIFVPYYANHKEIEFLSRRFVEAVNMNSLEQIKKLFIPEAPERLERNASAQLILFGKTVRKVELLCIRFAGSPGKRSVVIYVRYTNNDNTTHQKAMKTSINKINEEFLLGRIEDIF